jgi:hypothetical protein
MTVWTCTTCGAVTFFSGPYGLGDIMGDNCDCNTLGWHIQLEDTVLVVWDEQE